MGFDFPVIPTVNYLPLWAYILNTFIWLLLVLFCAMQFCVSSLNDYKVKHRFLVAIMCTLQGIIFSLAFRDYISHSLREHAYISLLTRLIATMFQCLSSLMAYYFLISFVKDLYRRRRIRKSSPRWLKYSVKVLCASLGISSIVCQMEAFIIENIRSEILLDLIVSVWFFTYLSFLGTVLFLELRNLTREFNLRKNEYSSFYAKHDNINVVPHYNIMAVLAPHIANRDVITQNATANMNTTDNIDITAGFGLAAENVLSDHSSNDTVVDFTEKNASSDSKKKQGMTDLQAIAFQQKRLKGIIFLICCLSLPITMNLYTAALTLVAHDSGLSHSNTYSSSIYISRLRFPTTFLTYSVFNLIKIAGIAVWLYIPRSFTCDNISEDSMLLSMCGKCYSVCEINCVDCCFEVSEMEMKVEADYDYGAYGNQGMNDDLQLQTILENQMYDYSDSEIDPFFNAPAIVARVIALNKHGSSRSNTSQNQGIYEAETLSNQTSVVSNSVDSKNKIPLNEYGSEETVVSVKL